jgi:hypothetical protein
MNALSVTLQGKVKPLVAEESPEQVICIVRKYLQSRRPFHTIPEAEEEFFAWALACLTFAPTNPICPDMIATAAEDHAEWKRTGDLPYYIVTWREVEQGDIFHPRS